MAQKMTLEQYRKALGLRLHEMASRIEQTTGVHITWELLSELERTVGEHDENRHPVALPKAEAIASFLSAEMGRTITINDIEGLEVV